MKKLAFLGVVLIFLAILFFSALRIYRRIKASPIYFLSRVNLIFITAKPSIAILSLEKSRGIVVDLPIQDEVEVTRGFGKYKLGKVFELGELEGKGGILLKETVWENFHLPILGYIYVEAGKFEDLSKLKGWQKIILEAIKGEAKTDFSKIDLILLYIKSLRIKNEFYKTVGYSRSSDYFRDEKISSEALAVTILNASSGSQLAQRWSLLWEKIGGRVIRVANSEKETEEFCLINYADSIEKSYTVSYLKKLFGCMRAFGRETETGRDDVVLIFGRDYWKKLTEKW